MRIDLVIAGLLGTVVTVAACSDATSPAPRPHAAYIANIRVTDHATYGDTVKASFNYYTVSCDTGVVVQARPTLEGLRFTVTSWPTNRVCPLTLTSSIAGQPQGAIRIIGEIRVIAVPPC